MNLSSIIRQHWAALRALAVLTVLLGLTYPLAIWLLAQIPGLKTNADGSILRIDGKAMGSSLIGQSFTDADGRPLAQYFQSRPSAGDYDPLGSGASNLGPESMIDTDGKPSLLTQVCSRSATVAALDGVNGARPFCTGNGVGAVLAVFGPRNADGTVPHPSRVVSVNEPCATTARPFVDSYQGVNIECAQPGADYATGLIVPVRGATDTKPAVPADAVTASGSGLDPHISPAYADLQVARIARVRGTTVDQIGALLAQHTTGRALGFLGEPTVNVVELNLALDQTYPLKP